MGVYKFRVLRKKLRDYDKRFEFPPKSGRSGERVIYHPDINGQPKSIPVTCHGEGDEIKPGAIAGIRRRFNRPREVLP